MTRTAAISTLLALAGTSGATLAQVNFSPPQTYFVPDNGSGASPTYIAAGDLDGDGDTDLITDSNGPGNDPTTVFWNDGAGNFSMGPQLLAGWGFGEVDLADIDADGDLDVIRASYFSNGVYFFRNNGDSTFEPGIFYSGGGGCLGVVFTDIDGDNDPDFVALDKFGGKIRPYRNINGLGFTSVGLFACGANPYTIEAADMDNDGDQDIVVGNEDASTVTVVYNDGSGAFTSTRTVPVGERPTGIALADLNADGAIDIVSTDWGPLSPVNNTISVVLADGDGGFTPAVSQLVQGRPGSVAIGDIDGDSIFDIVVSCEADSSFAVLRGHGDGTFDPFAAFPAGASPGGIALADLDADGDADIASVGGDSMLVARNISGTPIEPTPYQIAWYAQYDNLFNEDIPTHAAIDSAGNLIVAGSTYFTANENDIQIIKLDSEGNLLWEYDYNGDGDHYDVVYRLKIDADDNVIVTGESWGLNFSIQWATIKLDRDGNQLWVRRYAGDNPQASQYPQGLDVSSSGAVGVTGWARDASFLNTFFTAVLYDADGTLLFDIPDPEGRGFQGTGKAVAFDPMGNLIATGNIDDDDEFGNEMLTTKIAPDGAVLWAVRHDVSEDPFFNLTTGSSVITDNAGDIYVGYKGVGSADGDARVIKYDADGAMLWDIPIAPGGSDVQLAFRQDGSILASVYAGLATVQLTALTPAGTVLWDADADAAYSSSNPAGHFTPLSNGTTATIDQVGTDIALVIHDAQGQFVSSTRVDSGSGSDAARAIVAGDGGEVYLLSQVQTEILSRRDYAVFRMDPAPPTCPADLAEPFGQLDFSDVAAFLSAFATSAPQADLAEPFGQWDFSDISAFLATFGAGCP